MFLGLFPGDKEKQGFTNKNGTSCLSGPKKTCTNLTPTFLRNSLLSNHFWNRHVFDMYEPEGSFRIPTCGTRSPIASAPVTCVVAILKVMMDATSTIPAIIAKILPKINMYH